MIKLTTALLMELNDLILNDDEEEKYSDLFIIIAKASFPVYIMLCVYEGNKVLQKKKRRRTIFLIRRFVLGKAEAFG